MPLFRLAARRAGFIVLILALLSLSHASGGLAPASASQGNAVYAVRIAKEDYLKLASSLKTSQVIDYGSFVWLELDSSALAQLQQAGADYQTLTNPYVLQLNHFAFDPIAGEPAIASTLKANYAKGATGFYLVQLAGPTKPEWLTQLSALGATVIQYQPNYAYIVRMSSDVASQVARLTSVRWAGEYHTLYRISPKLMDVSGKVTAKVNAAGLIETVTVTIYDHAAVDKTVQAIRALGGHETLRERWGSNRPFVNVTFALPASSLLAVARLDNVLWLNYRLPVDILEDEMSDQIIAGNFNPLAPGYNNFLATRGGFDGSGVTVALIDSGFDTGDPNTAHPAVGARLIPVGSPVDNSGHGTHVGGIIAGAANPNTTDASNFLMGLGVAPNVNLVARYNSGAYDDRTGDVIAEGATAANNSYTVQDASSGYTATDALIDSLVRDGDTGTAGNQPITLVFSVGNCGGGGADAPCNGNTGPTKEAKNIIAVANSLNDRDGNGNPLVGNNIDQLSGGSSFGPAGDGRTYPHITAPGSNVISTRSTQAGIDSCENIATGAPATDPTYSTCSGTSMAAPHVTGAVALLTQWWRSFHSGATPSPAMLKALVINGATDMGTVDVPNSNEGWGRLNLSRVLNPPLPAVYRDQTSLLIATGITYAGPRVTAGNPAFPMRITLVWSDAPGAGGGGNTAAWVNDLDLIVLDGGNVLRGNNLVGGFTQVGGVADTMNNAENVFIQNPTGTYDLRVFAANIAGDGVPNNAFPLDQDFALVCYNCVEVATPGADLAVTKTDGPDPVRAGSTLSYVVVVKNNGPDGANNVVLSDPLPAGTLFQSLAAPVNWTCNTPAVNTNGVITCFTTSLGVGASAVFNIVVRVDPSVPNNTLLANTPFVSSTTPDPDPSNNSTTATTLVITRADLTITKTDNPDPVAAGANLTYGIGVANNGPSNAENVEVLEVIPVQTTFVSLVSPPGWICSTPPVGSTGTIDCDKTTMIPGESATFTVVVRVDPATPDGMDISDTTTVQSDTEDPVTTNNSSTSSTRVIARADVSITKSDTPDPVTAGIQLTYAISVTNTGPSIAKDLNVIDTLPNAVQFVSVTPPLGWVCVNPATSFGGTLSCTKLELNPATTDVISVVVFVPANTPSGTKFTNHVSVSSTQTPDPFPSNNTFTQETTVITRAALVISKSDTPDPVRRDFPLTYTLVVTNTGPSDAQNVKITDVLPALASFVSATPSAGAVCTTPAVGATGTVQCTWAGATVPTGVRSVTIVVRLCADINCAPTVDNPGTTSSDTIDPNPGDNSSTATTTVLNTSKPAVFRSPIATWFLRLNLTSGPAHFVFPFGQPGDTPLMCDWDGDGVETIGVVRGNAWLLRNANSAGPNDIPAFQFGLPTDTPICGDWDGNGTQTPGVVRDGIWFLRNSNSGGNADLIFAYGAASDRPVVGDWDGDGTDSPGVFRNGAWFLRNSNSAGFADITLAFGIAGDTPISGDWDGDNVDTVGIVRGNVWYLRDSNTTGVADIVFIYGALGDVPLVWK